MYTTFLNGFNIFERSHLCLFLIFNFKIINFYYNLKLQFSILIHFKM